MLTRRPCYLVYGCPDNATTERIFRQTAQMDDYIQNKLVTIHPWFVDIEANLFATSLLMQALDGLDIQRSFESVVRDGEDAKPIYEWDE